MYVRSTIIILFFGISSLAQAVLGEKIKNSETKTVSQKNLSVYAHQSGTVNIKEFTDTKGKVFAVSWIGKTHPNIEKLFGAHFSEFSLALKKAKETHRGHGPLRVTLDNLHLELGGSMRNVQGRAWLVNQTPAGVSTYDIR